MRLTVYTDYALRVLMYLALKDDQLATIEEIARSYAISKNHLMKVVHQLGLAGYIDTVRGRRGGIRRAKAAKALRLGEVVRQTERVMANLAAILESAGLGWGDVVKTTVYLHDMSDFPVVNEVYAKALGESRPARSTVQVSALPRGVHVEIDAIVALR